MTYLVGRMTYLVEAIEQMTAHDVPLDIYVDSKSLFDTLSSNSKPSERRLMIMDSLSDRTEFINCV